MNCNCKTPGAVWSVLLLALCVPAAACSRGDGKLVAKQKQNDRVEQLNETIAGSVQDPENEGPYLPSYTAQKVALGIDNNCVDPDLTKIPIDVGLTMCDGSFAYGMRADLPVGASTVFPKTGQSCPANSKILPQDIREGVEICGVKGTLRTTDLSALVPENLRAGVEIDGIRGTIALPDLTNLVPENVRSGVEINGVTGALPVPDLTGLVPENVRSGVEINGVTGALPVPDLTGLVPENVRSGVEINGVTGALPVPDLTGLVPENIREDVTIAGVTGTLVPAVPRVMTIFPTVAPPNFAQEFTITGFDFQSDVSLSLEGFLCGAPTLVTSSELRVNCTAGAERAGMKSTLAVAQYGRAGVSQAAPVLVYNVGFELDAASLSVFGAGTSIASWSDTTTASGFVAVQTDPTRQPSLVYDSSLEKFAIDFQADSGFNDYFVLSGSEEYEPSEFSAVAVILKGTSSSWSAILGRDFRGNGSWTSPFATVMWSVDTSSSGSAPRAGAALTPASWQTQTGQTYTPSLISVHGLSVGPSGIVSYVNGSSDVSSAAGVLDWTNKSIPWTLGSRSDATPGEFFTGRVYEVRSFSHELLPAQLEHIANGYCVEYGLSWCSEL